MRRSASTLVAPGWQLNISRRPQVALEEAAGSCVAEKSWTGMPFSARAYLARVYLMAFWSLTGLTPILQLSQRQDNSLCPGPLRKLKAAVGDTLRCAGGFRNSNTPPLSTRTALHLRRRPLLRPELALTSVAPFVCMRLTGCGFAMDLRAAAATNILNGGKAGHQCVGSASEDDTLFFSISFALFDVRAAVFGWQSICRGHGGLAMCE